MVMVMNIISLDSEAGCEKEQTMPRYLLWRHGLQLIVGYWISAPHIMMIHYHGLRASSSVLRRLQRNEQLHQSYTQEASVPASDGPTPFR